MREKPDYLMLGEVLRPHGVRGELRLRILTDYPQRIGSLKTVYLAANADGDAIQPYTVESMRMNGDYGLLKLQEIPDRNAAERLRELFVLIDLENAVPLEEGEYYLYELIGMTVITVDGVSLGKITDVIETGANDVYVVQDDAGVEILLPDIPQVVKAIDLDIGQMTITLIDGLLPTTKAPSKPDTDL